MIIALSFVLPSIVLFNSFMMGRIIKRYQKELNNYLSLTYGFFLFLAVIQVFFIPLISISYLNVKIFLYYLVAIQILCLIAYGINWRYSFMMVRFNWKEFLLVICGFLIVIGICFGLKQYHKHYVNPYNLEVIKYYSLSWKEPIFFTSKITYLYLIEGINRSFAWLFSVHNFQAVYQYPWMISFATIISFGIFGLYFQNKSLVLWRIITYFTIVLGISVASLILISTPSNGISWLIFGTLLLFQAHIENIKRIKYELGIFYINFISLALFTLSASSLYIILLTNTCISMLSYVYRRNNATDYNILILFTSVMALSLYLYVYNFIVGIVFTIISLVFYTIYFFIRKTILMYKLFVKLNNISNFVIKFISYGIGFLVLLIAVFLLTIWGKFNFNYSPWVINYFLNKDLIKMKPWFWVINSVWWSLNIVIIIYAFLTQFLNKKLLSYIDNVRLTPVIINNTITVWNPISSSLWMIVGNSNALMVTNDFLVNLVPTLINFIYYLNNKTRVSRSLVLTSGFTVLISSSLIIFNLLA